MSNNFKIGLGFLAGLIIGGFAMKKYVEKDIEYEYIVEPENDELENKDIPVKEAESVKTDKPNQAGNVSYNKIRSTKDPEYTKMLDDLRYSTEKEKEEEEQQNPLIELEEVQYKDNSKPYMITEEEFEDGYESDEYTYYADGFLTDSYGLPVSPEDIERTIGQGFEREFDDPSTDQIWVRNEQLQLDFSIIRDLDNFRDVAPPRIRRMAGL